MRLLTLDAVYCALVLFYLRTYSALNLSQPFYSPCVHLIMIIRCRYDVPLIEWPLDHGERFATHLILQQWTMNQVPRTVPQMNEIVRTISQNGQLRTAWGWMMTVCKALAAVMLTSLCGQLAWCTSDTLPNFWKHGPSGSSCFPSPCHKIRTDLIEMFYYRYKFAIKDTLVTMKDQE